MKTEGRYAELELITPERAQALLALNTSNRRVQKGRVRQYAADMQAKRWRTNGETIKISKTGRVLDGQHRLHAVIASGVPIYVFVVYGLDEEDFKTIDIGKKRTGGDTLSAMGVPNSNIVAAALHVIAAYDLRQISTHGYKTRSNEEIADLFQVHKELLDSLRADNKALRSVVSKRSLSPAMHYLFSRVDGEAADKFMSDLATGAMLPKYDPVLTLRETLLKERYDRKRRIPVGDKIAFFIKAWNARRQGRQLRLLRLSGDEAFPEVLGRAPLTPKP